MSIVLADEPIADFDSCVHHELLAYVKYPYQATSSRCFAYPQYLLDDNNLSRLKESAFPDVGCLPMAIASATPSQLKKLYGDVVVMILNTDSPDENRNYGYGENSKYNSIINPNFAKGKSAVEFKALSNHRLSSELMQVLEVQETVDFSQPIAHPLHLYSGDLAPQTNLALVAQVENGKKKYFGPFECSCLEDEVTLSASSFYDTSIAGFNEATFGFAIDLLDADRNVVAQFVSSGEFAEKFKSSGNVIDWISNGELLDAIGRVSRTDEEPFTKSQVRALKAAISKCLEEDAKIALTPKRREKMLSLLSTYDDWSSLPSEVKIDAIDGADPEKLAEFVLSNENFRGFFDKVIEVERVRDRVEQERARYASQAEAARRDAEEAESRKEEVQAELATYQEELALKRRQLKEEIAQETETARQERDALTAEVSKLAAEKKTLEEDKILVERQIRRTIDDMSDELLVSNKILENEMIKQIVLSINASGAGDDDSTEQHAPHLIVPTIFEDEKSMTAAQVLDSITHSICEIGGRDLTRNEVANLMIAITQGYVLTLAGLPGTGKTSLASLIAGALGLENRGSRRFAEISVERGWTSYKDFIGYYNPLTQTVNASNALVFDAFAALDNEAKRELDKQAVPPYLFLLDEANLSPIEHYWSPFLRACDSFEDGPFALPVGGDCCLRIPEYVRFIATVNFDHTTEELSPRFLDRSWVVTLGSDALDFEDDELRVDWRSFGDAKAFSYSKLQETFGSKPNTIMGSDLKSKLNEVLEICSKHRHLISPRSQRMIWNYICVAEKLMDRSTAQTALAPVDFAVAQKVLPGIAGMDEKVKYLLEQLGGVSGLPVTRGLVDHILEVGNACGYYQYFA